MINLICGNPHTQFYLIRLILKGENLTCDFINPPQTNIELYIDILTPISFKLYIFISVWKKLTVIQGHIYMRNFKTLMPIFSEITKSICMKFSMLPQPVGLLKLMLPFFNTSNIQGRELCWCDFIKYTINIYPVLGHTWADLFRTWYYTRNDWTLQFNSSVNNFDVHSRSQGHENARTCAVIILWSRV